MLGEDRAPCKRPIGLVDTNLGVVALFLDVVVSERRAVLVVAAIEARVAHPGPILGVIQIVAGLMLERIFDRVLPVGSLQITKSRDQQTTGRKALEPVSLPPSHQCLSQFGGAREKP